MLCEGSKFKIISFQVVYFFSGTFSFLHSGWFTALSALSAAALKKLSLSLLSFINFEKITFPSLSNLILIETNKSLRFFAPAGTIQHL